MKKIDKAIMLLRSIPEDKLDAVIGFLTAYAHPPKRETNKPADIISISDKITDNGRED